MCFYGDYEMEIIRLESKNTIAFQKICDWYYEWIGKKNGQSRELVEATMSHSLCTGNRLPQTFIAMLNGIKILKCTLAHPNSSGCIFALVGVFRPTSKYCPNGLRYPFLTDSFLNIYSLYM